MYRFARVGAVLCAVCWMAACQAAIQHQQEKKAEIHYFNTTVDRERILVSTGDIANAHEQLGEVSYSEPLSGASIDSAHVNNRLRQLAIDKWGTQVDALIDVKSGPNADATMIDASAVAVRIIGDCNFCRHNYTPEETK